MWKTALIIFLFVLSAQAQISRSYFSRSNENQVLRSLNEIHQAQTTYQAVYGAGNFAGNLTILYLSGFLDSSYLNSQKYGYRFVVTAIAASSTSPAKYVVKVTPLQYSKLSRKSFYLNESGDIRGSDINGAMPIGNEPLIEDCSNVESKTINVLRNLSSLEFTYNSIYGNYASLLQLRAFIVFNERITSGSYCGYSYSIQANSNTFRLNSTPQNYSVLGTRSFFIDQTGVLRGEDKQGLPADENDSPIQ